MPGTHQMQAAEVWHGTSSRDYRVQGRLQPRCFPNGKVLQRCQLWQLLLRKGLHIRAVCDASMVHCSCMTLMLTRLLPDSTRLEHSSPQNPHERRCPYIQPIRKVSPFWSG